MGTTIKIESYQYNESFQVAVIVNQEVGKESYCSCVHLLGASISEVESQSVCTMQQSSWHWYGLVTAQQDNLTQ